jgi:ribosomal protein L14
MDAGIAAVLGAVIASVGGIIVAVIQQFRQENRKDHGTVMEALDRVSNTVERVEGKVDSHINWHATGGTSGRTIRRNQGRSIKAAKK